MIWRMLDEWWIGKHLKESNAPWDAHYCKEAEAKKPQNTPERLRLQTKENSLSPCYSNRHYCLVSKNINIWTSSLCPLLLAVNDWMNGENKYKTEVHSNGTDIKHQSQHTTWHMISLCIQTAYFKYLNNTWIVEFGILLEETKNKRPQFLNSEYKNMHFHSFIHSLVFTLRGRVGRNHSPVMWPAWLWQTASWASSWG